VTDDVARFVLSFDTLKAWCVRQQYEFSENAAQGQLAIHYKLLGQASPLLILPQPERGMVMFAMRQPMTVPPERRAAVVDAAMLLNATSYMGAWVLNTDTGELVLRASIVTLDVGYTDEGLLHVARIVVGTSERAAPVFRAIALEGADPTAAIAAIAALASGS
jgi:hypothetical protein